jgi:hypothetical protein
MSDLTTYQRLLLKDQAFDSLLFNSKMLIDMVVIDCTWIDIVQFHLRVEYNRLNTLYLEAFHMEENHDYMCYEVLDPFVFDNVNTIKDKLLHYIMFGDDYEDVYLEDYLFDHNMFNPPDICKDIESLMHDMVTKVVKMTISHNHYQRNKEECKEKNRLNYQQNKRERSEYGRLYREKHKERIKKHKRTYALKHKEQIRAKYKEYSRLNPDKVKANKKRFVAKRKKIREDQQEYDALLKFADTLGL